MLTILELMPDCRVTERLFVSDRGVSPPTNSRDRMKVNLIKLYAADEQLGQRLKEDLCDMPLRDFIKDIIFHYGYTPATMKFEEYADY